MNDTPCMMCGQLPPAPPRKAEKRLPVEVLAEDEVAQAALRADRERQYWIARAQKRYGETPF